jgi:hypothetical protein
MIGHNKSPLDIIADLYDEATNWCDGEAVTNQKQANTLVDLIDQLRAARTAADIARKEEAKPFDDGKKAVQTKYNPYIQPAKGMVDRAIASIKEVLDPWLTEQDRLKREEDNRLRKEADDAMGKAAAAIQATAGDLKAREEAELRLDDAIELDKIAKRVAKKNIAKGARSRWDVVIDNRLDAARALWLLDPEAFDDVLLQVAKRLVAQGKREISGFTITERTTV